ncbi:hypothetical protein GCM10010266_67760 [Streptomyces griseomycini]|nr:hypothetical protein [Streptomyces griseomycini]GGQ34761.1 hypothetical protein GCM10010266_67760 [Streptomyces griseomycini]
MPQASFEQALVEVRAVFLADASGPVRAKQIVPRTGLPAVTAEAGGG